MRKSAATKLDLQGWMETEGEGEAGTEGETQSFLACRADQETNS